MRIALITGASSGMGSVFALRVDQTEEDIDAIWLVARRGDRLAQVARMLSHTAKILPLDLTEDSSIDALEESFAQGVQVGLFINCAGYGKIGNYDKVSRFDSLNMIDVNCRAAVATTLAVLPYMKAGDRIIEICSTSSFQPVPHLNIYAASKAFLYSYTRGLRMELLPRGIMVTAVCPWWVRDTEFLPVARDNESNSDTTRSIHNFLFSSAKENVVRRALRASRFGFATSTPAVMCFIHRVFSKVIPKKGLMYFWELLRRI